MSKRAKLGAQTNSRLEESESSNQSPFDGTWCLAAYCCGGQNKRPMPMFLFWRMTISFKFEVHGTYKHVVILLYASPYYGWEHLPYGILVSIYQHLPVKDRFNVSLTCRTWSQPFSQPVVWQDSMFVFNGRNDKRDLRFPGSLTSGLRHLVIDCRGTGKAPDKRNVESISYHLYTFLDNLVNSNVKLVTLKLTNMVSLSPLFRWTCKYDIYKLLRDFLSTQTTLQVLDLSLAGFNLNQGMEILTLMARTGTITVLAINELFKTYGLIRIATHVRLFNRLAELTLSDDYLYNELLEVLADTESLMRLSIFAHIHTFLTFPSRQAWEQLKRSRPNLKAHYFIPYKRLGSDFILNRALRPGIPIFIIELKSSKLDLLWKILGREMKILFQASAFRCSLWETVPYSALVKIYGFLGNQDKLNVALTCRAWSRPFSQPEVWQTSFLFNGKDDRCALRFPGTLATELRHLFIDCRDTGKPPTKNNKESTAYMYTFLDSLVKCNNSRLVSVKLIHTKRLSSWFGWTSNHDILKVLLDLLSIQTTLQLLDLSMTGFTVNQGMEILSLLARTSGSTVSILAINDFMRSVNPICIATQVRMFTRLTELTLSDDLLSEDLLGVLGDSQFLKLLNIFAQMWVEVTSPSGQAWEQLKRSRPDLEAFYFVPYKRLGRVGILKRTLTPGIPIVILDIKLSEKDLFWNIIGRHINALFQKNPIRRMNIKLCCSRDRDDLDVIIETCTVLEVTSITDRHGNNSVLARQPASPLIRLTFGGAEVTLDLISTRFHFDWLLGAF